MKTVQQGFTLIELMIVVAIIGILSMFALPAYQDYTKRTHVAEGIQLANAVKMASTEYYSSQGEWPADNDAAGVADKEEMTGNAVKSIEIVTANDAGHGDASEDVRKNKTAIGSLEITYNQKVEDDGTIILTAYTSLTGNASTFSWTCDQGTVIDKLRPSNCRKGGTTP